MLIYAAIYPIYDYILDFIEGGSNRRNTYMLFTEYYCFLLHYHQVAFSCSAAYE